ncbi:MAG: EamA family transporter [bacterium]|nr:EamA family transporter [bacterium]
MTTWIIYALLSAFFAALVAIFGKIGLKGIDATFATTLRSIIMAAFLVITSLALGKLDFHTQLGGKAFTFIALSGIAGALSWLFYFSALKNGPASGVAALDRLSVVFVLALALLFLGEQFTWKSSIGAFLIAAGAILMVIQ